ncbi:oxidoreductase : Putative dehydrogenase OS=Singulisphaera acidiphila (strain ATCC BAA-1392 / DSM 18658 / VKM B-2454 / MOB10) GN=Sinac_6114 PE=4 SV=1: GFO_IDH_MocA: GFO_IDH_MocA_C [Gemmataceae bacterium]|nr:oxidoreductase : Putative dehydrogenase OS=Singulisphaera acidiphila (strain ATCC BAA-1392 / DSM 18658 / VKM B-2454 / MOB10) GN=Sinac_6114 PE=4 SV=1: GFO_IDH_MocA: GFO_IDH_MocA_C [Gemmataceae bacterium]VTT97265.1 oxidoreductase : Putative dehydrogenase OS=Singulisphaera acidiphila (strain ATCC BAA-1392 / DSM 18658 / VKM B-2454 / MOB10) GN=Sinac_6114 PE=4 SV=1: GFO_IDH_MocA: GFO_IDH_MocA_C [Gemmataceae bacterium]
MKPTRVGLIGCGKVGTIHAAALNALPEAELVACCDAAPERAAAFATKYGGRAFPDVAAMLREGGVEAVVIGTPHPLHAGPAIQAAEAGVHVLVEKPLAASLSDADAMIAAAKKTGVTLGVISQRRFYEPVGRMKAAIVAGKIGTPALGVFLQYSWREAAYYLSDPWRGKWDTEGGGVLVNQSPHQLDILLWLMGPAAEVSGQWANVNHPGVEVDDTAVASIKFKNGGLGSIATSVAQKPGIYTKVHIHGSSGASVGVETDRGATFIAGVSAVAEPPLNDLWTVPGEEGLLAQFQAEDRKRFASMDETVHYHALQIADFLRSIREGTPLLVTAEDGRAVVELFTAIYRSAKEGRPIKLPI